MVISVRTAEKSDIDSMRRLMVQLCEVQGRNAPPVDLEGDG